VSENIIEASWEALVDAVDYGLRHPRVSEGDQAAAAQVPGDDQD
jgi:hypothetical protein